MSFPRHRLEMCYADECCEEAYGKAGDDKNIPHLSRQAVQPMLVRKQTAEEQSRVHRTIVNASLQELRVQKTGILASQATRATGPLENYGNGDYAASSKLMISVCPRSQQSRSSLFFKSMAADIKASRAALSERNGSLDVSSIAQVRNILVGDNIRSTQLLPNDTATSLTWRSGRLDGNGDASDSGHDMTSSSDEPREMILTMEGSKAIENVINALTKNCPPTMLRQRSDPIPAQLSLDMTSIAIKQHLPTRTRG
jgi:hypothetical protein